MTAKTKEQWLETLKGLIPRWVYKDPKFNIAILKGMARMLAETDLDFENHFKETFIDNSSGIYLKQHGDERNKERIPGETDSAYRQRIKRIRNISNCPELKELVDAYLFVGESVFVEDYNQTNFLNRNAYLNRGIINFPITYNSFTVFIEKQIPSRDTYFSREFFFDREAFIGSDESLLEHFQAIVNAINKNKAYGTVYRLLESVGA